MAEIVILNNLLSELSNSQHTVALGPSKLISAKDFTDDCSNLINKLGKEAHAEFILSCKNSYFFTVGLFSLLHLNKKVCLPPGMEKGLIEELNEGRGLISDFYPNAIHPIQEKSPHPAEFDRFPDGSISLFTSGSTGERKEIQKTLSQFNEEIKALNEEWSLTENQVIVSSVSHQHIYGLLFKILWPLATGRAFYIDECMFENELNAVFNSFPESVLISCPAHLDAMARFPTNKFLENRLVYSSGAPLSLTTAKEIQSFSAKCPIEVFGSTETGGIGFREQTKSSNWTLLKTVSIRVNDDETLSVKSPFCEAQNEWYETGDKAEILSAQSFKHLGRRDRIVKVSGKRLSLNEMEQQLKQSQLIEDCKVLVLAENSQTARESTAAIIVLTETGIKKLSDLGRRKLALLLKDELKVFFPAVVIPRFWRYIDEFPRNSQGKVEAELLSLFLLGYDEAEQRFPELKSISKHADKYTLNLIASKNCDFFEGHFPENPILPGVGQIFWAQLYADKLLNCKTVKGINKLKFHHVIQPGETCILELSENKNSIIFSFTVADKLCSSGSLNYG